MGIFNINAGMEGKEAYCFEYREGWMLIWAYPLLVLVSLGKESRIFNSLGFSALFILTLFLTGKNSNNPSSPHA